MPHSLKSDHSLPAELALAAAGLLKGDNQELWQADCPTLFQIWQRIVKYFSGHRRTRALHTLRRICSSRSGRWELPLTTVNVVIPWLGDGPPRLHLHSILRRFMRVLVEAYDGALPMFQLKQLRIKVSWSSTPSLGSILSTSTRWQKLQHLSVWPCVCATRGREWPRVRGPDGNLHICASLSEVPWPADAAWVAHWCCNTRLRPSAADIVFSVEKALLDVAAIRRLDSSPSVCRSAANLAEEIALSSSHYWRLQDLAVGDMRDGGAARAAAGFIRDFWVEQRDHAMHSAQVVCPALALTAIHKVWEYGAWASGEHFQYGTFVDFGFRDIDDLIEKCGHIDWLPEHLQPARLAARRRPSWDLSRARTLPKDSDPAGSHRPLCNRTAAPYSGTGQHSVPCWRAVSPYVRPFRAS